MTSTDPSPEPMPEDQNQETQDASDVESEPTTSSELAAPRIRRRRRPKIDPNELKLKGRQALDRKRILAAAVANDRDPAMGDLKAVIFSILLQEETYSIPEPRLYERVLEFEKDLVKRSKSLGLDAMKKSDPERWHCLDTYRIVLNAAWANDNEVSPDEADLLAVLRDHLRSRWSQPKVFVTLQSGGQSPNPRSHSRFVY